MDYHFYDQHRARISHHVDGAPMTRIHLWVNQTSVVVNGLGLIDTGSNSTCVAEGFLAARKIPSDRTETNTTGAGQHDISVNNNATIQLVGLAPIIPVVLRRLAHFSRADVLIGRDVLDYFKLVYDPLHGVFTVEDT